MCQHNLEFDQIRIVIVVGRVLASADYASEHSEAQGVTGGSLFFGFNNVVVDERRCTKCRKRAECLAHGARFRSLNH